MANLAVRELASKLRLEAIFIRELTTYFRQMRDAFVEEYTQNGGILDASTFTERTVEMLDKHYRRSQREFSGIVREENNIKSLSFYYEKKQVEDVETIFKSSLDAWRNTNAPAQADLITQTNQSDINDSVAQATQELSENGVIPPAVIVAGVAGRILTRKFTGRRGTIAVTETQSSAEATKVLEAESLTGVVPYSLAGQNVTPAITDGPLLISDKTWVTVGDALVRDSHVVAGGQKVELDNSFTVGGELMRHPGDTSQGATVGNVINCRCAARININGT